MRTYSIKGIYVDGDESWLGILSAATLSICSTENILKGYIPGQLVSVRDITLPIEHKTDW